MLHERKAYGWPVAAPASKATGPAEASTNPMVIPPHEPPLGPVDEPPAEPKPEDGPVAWEKHSMTSVSNVRQHRSAEPCGLCQPAGHGSHDGAGGPQLGVGQFPPAGQTTAQPELTMPQQPWSETQHVPGVESPPGK